MVFEGPEELEVEDSMYNDFENNITNREYLAERAIMLSTNQTIHERNFKFTEKLPGNMEISYSRDTCVEDDDVTLYNAEFLNRVNVSGIPPHRLPLKKVHVSSSSRILILKMDIAMGQGTLFWK